MKTLSCNHISKTLALAFTLAMATKAKTIRISTFATGKELKPPATGPDSITVGGGSVWVSYTNGADSTGKSGSSTVVQYDTRGVVRHIYSIAGSVDGLKIEPETSLVWA